jgi:hypothetical protein
VKISDRKVRYPSPALMTARRNLVGFFLGQRSPRKTKERIVRCPCAMRKGCPVETWWVSSRACAHHKEKLKVKNQRQN